MLNFGQSVSQTCRGTCVDCLTIIKLENKGIEES